MGDGAVFDQAELMFTATSLLNMPFRPVESPLGVITYYMNTWGIFVYSHTWAGGEAIFMSGSDLPFGQK